MTIIHLLIGLGGGGAEHLVLELAKQNKIAGNRVIVIGITSINLIEDKFKAYNIEYLSLKIDNASTAITGFRNFLKIIRKYPSSVIHAHMFHAGILACFAKLVVPSCRIAFTLHTNYVRAFYRRFLLYATRSVRDVDVIFSQESKKTYHKDQYAVIPNGIDTTKYQVLATLPEKFNCLFLGRLQEPKNPLYLVELVLKLKDKHKFVINVAGNGHLTEDLKKLIKENNLEDWFVFLGFSRDIPNLLAKSHCMIMPSLWEGMPISILEAGAAGVPIVSTPVGSIPSILNDKNAYLSELDSFHLSLAEVIDNYPLAKNKAQKLKTLVLSDYDIKNVAEKHHQLYANILNS